MNLEGARSLVTGGASGIGAAVVDKMRARGAKTAVLDLVEARGDVTIRCDVSMETEVVDAVARAHEELGGLDIAVLCAGVAGMAPILEMSSNEWDRVMAVNLRGAFLCLRESARRMAEHGGSIVVVTSISGMLADRLTSHYNASKAGAATLVRVAARELGPLGIRVNAVAPGTTDTPMFKPTERLRSYRDKVERNAALGRIGTAAEVAEAAISLVELEWVTGHVLVADGGLSLASPIDAAEDLRWPTR